MVWVVGVEVPEEVASPRLRQTPDVVLEQDSVRAGRWRLKQPLGPVQLSAARKDGVPAILTDIPANSFRTFKVVGAHGNRGRAVRRCTTGYFLVVVPESWQWNEALSGPPVSAAEPVLPGGFRAHHVQSPLEAGCVPAFTTADGTCVRIPCAEQHFDLTGSRVQDACENRGPLFVREPPQLVGYASGAGDIPVATIVIGEEGDAEGSRRWRASGEHFEDLRPAIASRRAGWFFVRVYDSEDELIESLDFRFLAGLAAIEVEAGSVVPGTDGHCATQISFLHGPDCSVQNGCAQRFSIEPLPGGSRVTISPSPRADKTQWVIGPVGGPHVEVTTLVERIWWKYAKDPQHLDEAPWVDRPVDLSREDFKATSNSEITLGMPRAGWAKEVRIGFDASRIRPVHLAASQRECLIYLRELGESRDIEHAAAPSLKVWLSPADRPDEWLEAVIGLLLQEPDTSAGGPKFVRSLSQMEIGGLMRLLSRMRKITRPPARSLICDLRKGYYRQAIRQRNFAPVRERFLREGLCLLALVLEQPETFRSKIDLRQRWVRRARAAAIHFPVEMASIRSRHQRLLEEQVRGAHRGGRVIWKRATAES